MADDSAFSQTSGAVADGTFVTLESESAFSSSFSLGSLSTGLLLNTVAAGVATVTKATEGTDYYEPGATDVDVADGGTGASTPADARTNLGLAIGSDVQAYDAGLLSLAGLTTAADKMIYTTASDTYAVADLTSLARNLLDDSSQAAMAATILSGASLTSATVAGTDKIIGQDADDTDNIKTFTAQSIADLAGAGTGGAPADATYIVQTANGTLTNEQAIGALSDGLLKHSSGVFAQAVADTDYQSADAGLISIAGLTTAANTMLYTTALDTYAVIAAANSSLLVTSGAGVPSLSTAIPDGVTATTQSASDNSTKVATTAYVDTAVGGAGGGVEHIATVTASSSSTVDFDNVFDSSYEYYFIIANDVDFETNGVDFQCRIGTTATPTYQATNYNWAVGTFYASGTAAEADTNDTEITLHDQSAGFGVGAAAGESTNLEMKIYNPADGTFNQVLSWRMPYYDEGGTVSTAIGGGGWDTATAVTSIQFFPSSDAILSGNFRLYGVVKS